MNRREGENRTVLPYADDDARMVGEEQPEEDAYELQRQRDIDEEREMKAKADMVAHEAAFTNWLHRQGDLSAKSVHQAVRAAFFDGAHYGLDRAVEITREIADKQVGVQPSDKTGE